MNRVAEFEKVSLERFLADMNDLYSDTYSTQCYDEEFVSASKYAYDTLKLPRRATSGSAGYDFYSPIYFILNPGDSIKIPTGIRVKIDGGWWLGCLPRSGLGFKYQIHLANTMGVIDSDYYHSSNEGHIMLKLVNDGTKQVQVNTGDAIAQGIFIPYGITVSDNADGVRDRGFGSTDSK